jgi:protein SCO1
VGTGASEPFPAEADFAALVERLAAGQDRGPLLELLREDHPVYAERGASAVVRMRGWALLAAARGGLPEPALVYVLEELDTGADAYLVAAAARALRSYPRPRPDFPERLRRALTNIAFHDDLLDLEQYGAYVVGEGGTTAVQEIEETLREVEERLAADEAPPAADCCGLAFRAWPRSQGGAASLDAVTFEDQDGRALAYGDFFRGRPAVVAFFYTRCENPQKCSLTIAKLAELQKQLAQRGADVRTAGVTYDPAYDLPARLRAYGGARGVRLDEDHRLLRATRGFDALRRHFGLGVGFVGSLVNRHKVELYLVDAAGRIVASFERLHWDVATVADRAAALASEPPADLVARRPKPPARSGAGWHALGIAASFVTAFLPKCPMCVAAYLSVFGIASVDRIPYSPVLLPLFAGLLLVNLLVTWMRCRATGRMAGFLLSAAGALTILVGRLALEVPYAGPVGVALTVVGALWTVVGNARRARVA